MHDGAPPFKPSSFFPCVQVSLGYYEKEVDAARAYDAESLRLRGPSGHINLPESRALIEAHLLQDEGAGNAISAGLPSVQAPAFHFHQRYPLTRLSRDAAGGILGLDACLHLALIPSGSERGASEALPFHTNDGKQ